MTNEDFERSLNTLQEEHLNFINPIENRINEILVKLQSPEKLSFYDLISLRNEVNFLHEKFMQEIENYNNKLNNLLL